MKKYKILLASLGLSLVLSACSGSNDTTEAGQANQTDQEITQTQVKDGAKETETADLKETESSDSEESQEAERFKGTYIIGVDEFSEKIDDPNTIIIDARGTDDSHVEGALSLAWGQLADVTDKETGEEGWGHMLEPEAVNPILSDLGLDPSKEIILYSNAEKGWGEDGRILWNLKAYGYDNLKMVDGGIEAIKKAEIPLTKEEVSLEPVQVEISEIDYTNTIDTKELSENYDDYTIIDVRNKEEYDGATLYGEAKGGHLPGAINIQYIDLFTNDGVLKSNEEIEQIFKDKGIEKDSSIVTYCTGGIRSAYMQVIMEMLGYDKVKNYQGSYYNWASTNEVE